MFQHRTVLGIVEEQQYTRKPCVSKEAKCKCGQRTEADLGGPNISVVMLMLK